MRRGRSTLLRWGAVVALALLAVATSTHFHEEGEGRADTCVLCHAPGSLLSASGLHERPDPAPGGDAWAPAPGHPRVAAIERRGSRGPPA